MNTRDQLDQAISYLDTLAQYAYFHGFHELDYNPVELVRASLAELLGQVEVGPPAPEPEHPNKDARTALQAKMDIVQDHLLELTALSRGVNALRGLHAQSETKLWLYEDEPKHKHFIDAPPDLKAFDRGIYGKPHIWKEKGLWRCRLHGLIYTGSTREGAYGEWVRHLPQAEK